MPKFRKRPVVIEATQWFKNGDHPEDNLGEPLGDPEDRDILPQRREGAVVRLYRRYGAGQEYCRHCGLAMFDHGWIDTLERGYVVCPGDWVITGVQKERYPCKPDIFAATYEAVSE